MLGGGHRCRYPLMGLPGGPPRGVSPDITTPHSPFMSFPSGGPQDRRDPRATEVAVGRSGPPKYQPPCQNSQAESAGAFCEALMPPVGQE